VNAGAARRRASSAGSSDRDWWLRLAAVLQAPSVVFPLLRDESDEAIGARQEPMLLVVLLAGIAGVLAAPQAGRLTDDGSSLLVVAAWAVFAGALYGLAAQWLIGLLIYLPSRWLGGQGSYRRSRSVVALSLVPVALSLVLVWPVRLALYGSDVFHTGGADRGSGAGALRLVELGALCWAGVLLVLGVRAVHGWTTVRAVEAVSVAIALVPLLVVLAHIL
jgi:hypothetical protein